MFGSNLKKFRTAGRSVVSVFDGSSEITVSHWMPLVFARQQMTAVRPDVAMRCLLMHKFRKGVFRLRNNFTEKSENFADLAFFDGRHLGTIAIAGLQDLKLSDVAMREKGWQLRGEAFPVDLIGGSKVYARLSRLRRLLGAFPAQRLTGNAETVGRPGRKVIGDGLAKRQKSDLLKVSFHSPAVQQSRVESVLKLETGVRLWARLVTRWQPANGLHLLP